MTARDRLHDLVDQLDDEAAERLLAVAHTLVPAPRTPSTVGCQPSWDRFPAGKRTSRPADHTPEGPHTDETRFLQVVPDFAVPSRRSPFGVPSPGEAVIAWLRGV